MMASTTCMARHHTHPHEVVVCFAPQGTGIPPLGGWAVATANGTFVVGGVVEPLGWPWLLWWQVSAVAARSAGCDGTTDLGAVACSVGAGGGPLGWWCAMAMASPANGDGGLAG